MERSRLSNFELEEREHVRQKREREKRALEEEVVVEVMAASYVHILYLSELSVACLNTQFHYLVILKAEQSARENSSKSSSKSTVEDTCQCQAMQGEI